MAGAPVAPALMEQMQRIVPNGEIYTPYGATEALPVSSIAATEVLEHTAARTRRGEGTCVGHPLPGVEVKIIKPDDAPLLGMDQVTELGAGEIGEMIVRGPSVTRHYDKLPDADAYSKIPERETHWHRMGDMAWRGSNGYIWFCGRKAECVLTREGPRYTDCCEAIFNQHPQVFRSALIDVGGGKPALVVEPEQGTYPQR